MILSRRASLENEQLDELHEAIVIRAIDPGVPSESVSSASRMGGVGSRLTGQHWDTLEAHVTYAINVPNTDMVKRREIFDMVNTWAMKKGFLRFNTMPGRRMRVDKIVVPNSGDLWNWTTDEYTITFRAYNIPFWQSSTANTVTGRTAAEDTLELAVDGNMETVLSATFENKSGKEISNFEIEAGGNKITLTGIGLGGNESLVIRHGYDGILRITAGGRNVYSKYTGDDDLYIQPGMVQIHYKASRAGILTPSAYGRWV